MRKKNENSVLRHTTAGRAILLAAASAGMAAGTAQLSATTVNLVQVTGTNGSSGIAAQSATADAVQSVPDNTAIAVGGSGGIFTSSVITSGYTGASASANATTQNNPSSSGDINSTAQATGGAGGYDTIISPSGQSENIYGNGGAASAAGSAVNHVPGGNATTILTAIGGNAGYARTTQAESSGSTALGGLASATGQAWATGDGTATIIGVLKNGNDAPGTPADARVMAIPMSSIGAYSQTGTANASLTVTGGNAPGFSGAPGSGLPGISVANAVSGYTSGTLNLTQIVNAGSATNDGGIGGGASSSLDASTIYMINNVQPTNLNLVIDATAGSGGLQGGSSPTGGSGGNAVVSGYGVLVNSGNVTITASAIGGNGGGPALSGVGTGTVPANYGNGGMARTGQMFGQSQTGNVSVSLTLQGGNGGNGVSENSLNAVSGTTAGNLSLSQTAIGGNALNVDGNAGEATSILQFIYPITGVPTPTSLSLTANAIGGNGGPGAAGAGIGAINGMYGGLGTVGVSGILTGNGAVTISGTAVGGSGGLGIDGANFGAGGSAGFQNQLVGKSGTGDVSVSGTAIGGNGGAGAAENLTNEVTGDTAGSLTLSQTAVGGNALAAESAGGYAGSNLIENYSFASTGPPSSLNLTAKATGGNGGAAITSGSTQLTSGAGANAQASAQGIVGGASSVTVSAIATGGNGGAGISGNVASPSNESLTTNGAPGQAGSASLGTVMGQSDTGSVNVSGTVIGGSGATGQTVDLSNAVKGTTAGTLSLSQFATGGNSLAAGNAGANANSTFFTNFNPTGSTPIPSSLALTAVAVGGNGANQDAFGAVNTALGAGGNAVANINASVPGSANLTISATAKGGTGETGPDGTVTGAGGLATLSQIFGQSVSGNVSISGTAIGGNGQNGQTQALRNQLQGITTGALSLIQTAIGGNGEGSSGNGGYALSAFQNDYSSGGTIAPSGLTLNVIATGGNGANASISSTAPVDNVLAGNGADARATASEQLYGNANVSISATASGGNGGAGADSSTLNLSSGTGGYGQLGPVFGGSGSGNVSVSGTAVEGSGNVGTNEVLYNDVSGSTSGNLSLTQNAVGGSATGFTNVGGTASSDLNETYFSVQSEPQGLSLTVSAAGGSGGAAGGALAAGAGGAGSVGATGILAGAGNVNIVGNATGGSGGQGLNGTNFGVGGTAGFQNQLVGQSDTGDVSVTGTATAGNGQSGASEELNNAVFGRTAGNLLLSQTANGGNALGSGGNGGYASSLLNNDSTSSSITMIAAATGGNGLSQGTLATGGYGGNATAGATAYGTGNANIAINVSATGGNSGAEPGGTVSGKSGEATLGPIAGNSGSGDVTISATATGGNGENGASENLYNAISGQTQGSLSLSQTAIGGNAIGNGGSGGQATSSLAVIQNVSNLTLAATAVGGANGALPVNQSAPVNSPLATAIINATNASGNISATATATGGDGGLATNSGPYEMGGGAAASADASTAGNFTASSNATATSGQPGAYVINIGDGPASNPAQATAVAESGGAANANAVAETLNAYTGGNSVISQATATSSGGGAIQSTAIAKADYSSQAIAQATGSGGSGTVSSASTTNMGAGSYSNRPSFVQSVQATALAPVVSGRQVITRAASADPALLQLASTVGTSDGAYSTILASDSTDAGAILAPNPGLSANFNFGQQPTHPYATLASVSSLSLISSATSPAARTFSASFTQTIDPAGITQGAQDLLIGTVQVNYTGTGTIELTVADNGTIIADQKYASLAAAAAGLSGSTLDMGSIDGTGNGTTLQSIDISLYMTTSDGSTLFAPEFIVANGTMGAGTVPEPTELALLALGAAPLILLPRIRTLRRS